VPQAGQAFCIGHSTSSRSGRSRIDVLAIGTSRRETPKCRVGR
jgi:hypothetical protein